MESAEKLICSQWLAVESPKFQGERIKMDVEKKHSVLETWRALKRIDERDLKKGAKHCNQMSFNWSDFVKKDAKSHSSLLMEPVSLPSLEPRPFIIDTPKYQREPGELQRVLNSAAKEVLQRGEKSSDTKRNHADNKGSHSPATLDSKSLPNQEEKKCHNHSFQRLEAKDNELDYEQENRSKGEESSKMHESIDDSGHEAHACKEGKLGVSFMKNKEENAVTVDVEMKTFLKRGDDTLMSSVTPDEETATVPCTAGTGPSPRHVQNGGGGESGDHREGEGRGGDTNVELKTFRRIECSRSTPDLNPKEVKMKLESSLLLPLKTATSYDHDLMKKINTDVNCLLHDKASVRYEALLSIHCILLGDFPGEVNRKGSLKVLIDHPVQHSNNQDGRISQEERTRREQENLTVLGQGMFESAENFVECVRETVTKSILRRFGDPSEKCRLLAISLITLLLQSSPPTVVSLMSYIFPTMIERLPIKSLPKEEDSFGKIEILVVEPSEEVRLALVQLLYALLLFAKKKVKYFASEVASILTAAAMDTHPEVGMEASRAITMFGELCKQRLKPVARQLISALLGSLSHKRYRVRLTALRAIHRLVLCGAHESIYDLTAFQDPNLVPIRAFYQPCPKTQYLALLASDKNLHVREELLRTVASWLRELWERKEHECRLIPYLLTGFTDENPQIQHLAFELMEGVGRQYEEENPREVEDVKEYMREDIDDMELLQNHTILLPPSFKHRPCLGSRIMVRSCLSVMLHALAGDLDAWTSGTKALAADFLYTVLMFAEENITMHLQALVMIMQKAFTDSLVHEQIGKCAKVLGFFTDPTAYLKVVLPLVSGEMDVDASSRQLGASLKMLASIMSGTPSASGSSSGDTSSLAEQRLHSEHPHPAPKKKSVLTEHIPELCSLLSAPHLLTSIEAATNEGTVEVVRELVRAYSPWESEAELTPLLWILLNAAASSDFCSRSASHVELALEELAAAAAGTVSQESPLSVGEPNVNAQLAGAAAQGDLTLPSATAGCRASPRVTSGEDIAIAGNANNGEQSTETPDDVQRRPPRPATDGAQTAVIETATATSNGQNQSSPCNPTVCTRGELLIADRAEAILDLLPHPMFWNLRALDALVFCRILQLAPFLPLSIHPRICRLVVFSGRGSADSDLQRRLLTAIERMCKRIASVQQLQRSDRSLDELKASLQEQVGNILTGFFEPCLLSEDPSLIGPTLTSLSDILSHEWFSTTAIPDGLVVAVETLLRDAASETGSSAQPDDCTCEEVGERNFDSQTQTNPGTTLLRNPNEPNSPESSDPSSVAFKSDKLGCETAGDLSQTGDGQAMEARTIPISTVAMPQATATAITTDMAFRSPNTLTEGQEEKTNITQEQLIENPESETVIVDQTESDPVQHTFQNARTDLRSSRRSTLHPRREGGVSSTTPCRDDKELRGVQETTTSKLNVTASQGKLCDKALVYEVLNKLRGRRVRCC